MIVDQLMSTIKKHLRHTRNLYIHVFTNSHHRQYQSALYCRLLPLESRVLLVSKKFNKPLCCLVAKLKILSPTKFYLIDLNAEFQNNHDHIHKDGLHPSKNSVKAIVKSHRINLINLKVEISHCTLSIRPKHNQQMPKPSENLTCFFKKKIFSNNVSFGKGLLFLSNRLDALVHYHNCNAKNKIICECSVMGYLESTQVHSAKIYSNFFVLYNEVESNPGPTFSDESILAITENVLKTLKFFT